jgi:hypothetical protein
MNINRKAFLKSLGFGAVGTLAGKSLAQTPDGTQATDAQRSGPIKKRKLGKNGLTASVLCLGAGSRFTRDDFLPAAQREAYLRYAMSQGVNYIDTAVNYGQSETILGELLGSDDRDKLVISSKTPARTYDNVMRDFETSTKNLKCDYLDVFLAHNNALSDNVEDNRQTFSALLNLRERSLVGNIGFSSHSAVSLPVAVQLVKEFDLDHLVLTAGGAGYYDYRPTLPEILATGCTAAAIKVVRNFEGKGPVESARLSYKDVLDRSFTSGIISHSNAGLGEQGWKTVLDENLKTARAYA